MILELGKVYTLYVKVKDLHFSGFNGTSFIDRQGYRYSTSIKLPVEEGELFLISAKIDESMSLISKNNFAVERSYLISDVIILEKLTKK